MDMRVADYMAKMLQNEGVKELFIVTGGGIMFLTDGIIKNGNIHPVPCLHEQAASMAAIGYAQSHSNISACYVTTGCGGTNAITGVLHAYQDHVPVIYVSGQCNRAEMMSSVPVKVRSIGQQEADIVSIVKSITKYAVTIMDEKEAAYEIEKAIFLAKTGNPGPVWIDIPLDIQEANIEEEKVSHFIPDDSNEVPSKNDIDYIVSSIANSKRPIIIAGQGIKLANANDEFKMFIENNNIPFVGTRLGWDVYPNDSPKCVGLADIRGQRAANFALQNADVVLCLGTRLSLFTTGYNYNLFCRFAKEIIVVDIDNIEHKKGTVRITKEINCDVKLILMELNKKTIGYGNSAEWMEKCLYWKKHWHYKSNNPNPEENKGISKFDFIYHLNRKLPESVAIVTDAGATTEIPMQSLVFTKSTQRYFGSGTQCEMGYSIPASIGVAMSKRFSQIYCIVGDGSLQMNIQELQTIKTQNIPLKIFVWNNGCYATIRGHQKNIFHENYLGVDSTSGLIFPDLEKIAYAYGYVYLKIIDDESCTSVLQQLEDFKSSAVIIDVLCWKEEINPMVKAKMMTQSGVRVPIPMEDMYPFLSREELKQEMIAPCYEWWK